VLKATVQAADIADREGASLLLATLPSAQHLASWTGLCPATTRVPANGCQASHTKEVHGCVAVSAKQPGLLPTLRLPLWWPGFAAWPRARERSALYRELGADYLDRTKADQLKRYFVQRLERLGLQVTGQSREEVVSLAT